MMILTPSLLTARLRRQSIGMATFGSPHLYRELAEGYGVGRLIAGIRAIDAAPAMAYADPEAARPAVEKACEQLVEEDDADVIVLCGAALAGMSRAFGAFRRPVIDGIVAGARLCEIL